MRTVTIATSTSSCTSRWRTVGDGRLGSRKRMDKTRALGWPPSRISRWRMLKLGCEKQGFPTCHHSFETPQNTISYISRIAGECGLAQPNCRSSAPGSDQRLMCMSGAGAKHRRAPKNPRPRQVGVGRLVGTFPTRMGDSSAGLNRKNTFYD